MQLGRYFTAAVLTLITAALPAAQSTQAPPERDSEFTIFLGGVPVGREQVRLSRRDGNWVVTSTGQSGAPLNLAIQRFELEYATDWQPVRLHISAQQGPRQLVLSTTFGVTTAVNEITQNGVMNTKTDQITARTVVLPNNFYASYEGLAARLAGTPAGTELPVYVAPQSEIRMLVKAITPQHIQSPSGALEARAFALVFQNPGSPLDAELTIDSRGRFIRLEIPAQNLAVVRSDLATIQTRFGPVRNPTDTDVSMPGSGFTLSGTLTVPPGTGRLRHPVVVLVAGSGPGGRDEVVAGIPIFAQLAGALAEQGVAVVRYDKRGVGQSGGRTERVTLQDHADDLMGVVKWLGRRKDIDPKRIAVAGHSEGGAVAMLAAAREKKIASLVLVAAPGTTGTDLVLEQQKHLFEVANTPEAERTGKIALQKKIHAAVIADGAWEGIPPELRAQADSPLFRSLLLFDPAKVMPKVRQPILIVQGDLDKQVLPHHAETLAALARARKNGGPVEVVHLQGINHLLVSAGSGEVSEYGSLKERTVAATIVRTLAEWLRK
jgi:pimeloyl-ACP methyl ester carboxylesterase